MSPNNLYNIVVADSSFIVRSGLSAALKRLPDIRIQTVEIENIASLRNYVQLHTPHIVIINPNLGGWFDPVKFKAAYPALSATKFVALLTGIMNAEQLRDYNESFTIFDSLEAILHKLNEVLKEKDEDGDEQEALSQREKEIISYVVKGYTNKAIADKLCLSVHTITTHRRNIAKKLQIHTSAGLTIYAIANKLVELKDINVL